MTVAEWGPTAYAPRETARLMRTLRARHVDTVTLVVVWMQASARANVIRPGGETVSDARLTAAVRAARRAGLRVVLRPYVDVPSRPAARLSLNPTSPSRWWTSYRAFVLRYAALAARERASGFVVGTELSSMSRHASRWRPLVTDVRRRFRGYVMYQANWYLEPWRISWWSAVDAISISAYFPLANAPGATTAELAAAWVRYVDRHGQTFQWLTDLQALSSRYRRPVVFGEIGYRTVNDTATHPWDVSGGSYDARAQADAYAAAFERWFRVRWFRGYHWWYVNPQPSLVDGLPGADHRPAPRALSILADWYARRR